MAFMEWMCQECNIFWERECPVGKAPDRTRCPKCNTLSDRYFGNQGVNVSWGDDTDFHSHRARIKKFEEKGYDKTAGDRWLNRNIAATKDAMNDESFRYKPANLNYENMARDGKVKKLSKEEAQKKMDRAKNLTEKAYDVANKQGHKDIGSTKLDVTKPQKQQ